MMSCHRAHDGHHPRLTAMASSMTESVTAVPSSCGNGIAVEWPETVSEARFWQARPSVGATGEDLAVAHLLQHGVTIMDRNWRSGDQQLPGELDVVGFDPRRRLVIVAEVKVRSRSDYGGAVAAITGAQQRRIRRLTAAWVARGAPSFAEVRFDLIAFDVVRGSGQAELLHIDDAW